MNKAREPVQFIEDIEHENLTPQVLEKAKSPVHEEVDDIHRLAALLTVKKK